MDDNTVGMATRVKKLLHSHAAMSAGAASLMPDELFSVNETETVLGFFSQGEFFDAIKVGYTIGHSVSLISLTVAIIILCLFR